MANYLGEIFTAAAGAKVEVDDSYTPFTASLFAKSWSQTIIFYNHYDTSWWRPTLTGRSLHLVSSLWNHVLVEGLMMIGISHSSSHSSSKIHIRESGDFCQSISPFAIRRQQELASTDLDKILGLTYKKHLRGADLLVWGTRHRNNQGQLASGGSKGTSPLMVVKSSMDIHSSYGGVVDSCFLVFKSKCYRQFVTKKAESGGWDLWSSKNPMNAN